MKFILHTFYNNSNPASDFIRSQTEQTQNIIEKYFERYEQWDLMDLLKSGAIQKFKNQNFYEVTFGNFRFTGVILQRTMYLVHGFKKQSNKTSRKDIATSSKRVHKLLDELKI